MYIHLKLKRSFCYLFFFVVFLAHGSNAAAAKRLVKKTSSPSACSRYRLSLRRSTVIREESCERVCVCVHYFLLLCFGIFFVGFFFSYRKEKLKSASYKQTKSLENLSKINRCLAFRCHFLLFSFVSIFFTLLFRLRRCCDALFC